MFNQTLANFDVFDLFCQRYPDHVGEADGSETDANENLKMYYHRIGEDQEQDVLVIEMPENPSWLM